MTNKLAQVVLAVVAIVAVVLLMHAGKSRSGLTSDQREFMDLVRTKIEADHPRVKIVRENGFGWTLKLRGDHEANLGLDNAYAAYQREPGKADAIISSYLASLDTPQSTATGKWEDAKPNLMPAIKPADYLEQCRRQSSEKYVPVSYDFEKGLSVLIVIDSKSSMQFVDGKMLGKWKVTKEELWRTAISNLERRTPEAWHKPGKAKKRALAFNCGDCYDAARILLPDFAKKACRRLGCRKIAVAIPTRDMLFAVPAEDAKLVAEVAKIAKEEASTAPYSITSELIIMSAD